MQAKAKVALCLPGGGVSGAMYQIGALAALEARVADFSANDFDLYVGASSGASVAAVLAGGLPAKRLYRAFLDPADAYFGLKRMHYLRVDVGEWRRTLTTSVGALRRGIMSLIGREVIVQGGDIAQELERLYDSLPAGLFTLDGFERFLADFFVRREVPNNFHAMPRTLRVMAHELDTGKQVLFGEEGLDELSVTRACVAAMAVPPFYSPVRIGEHHYFDAGACQPLSVAEQMEADVAVVVNPMVPVGATQVPTGHGKQSSIRDKGLMWVVNQARRIAGHALQQGVASQYADADTRLLLIEPLANDAQQFMYNPSDFASRRRILEQSYRATLQQLDRWFEQDNAILKAAGWQPAQYSASEYPPGVS